MVWPLARVRAFTRNLHTRPSPVLYIAQPTGEGTNRRLAIGLVAFDAPVPGLWFASTVHHVPQSRAQHTYAPEQAASPCSRVQRGTDPATLALSVEKKSIPPHATLDLSELTIGNRTANERETEHERACNGGIAQQSRHEQQQ